MPAKKTTPVVTKVVLKKTVEKKEDTKKSNHMESTFTKF